MNLGEMKIGEVRSSCRVEEGRASTDIVAAVEDDILKTRDGATYRKKSKVSVLNEREEYHSFFIKLLFGKRLMLLEDTNKKGKLSLRERFFLLRLVVLGTL